MLLATRPSLWPLMSVLRHTECLGSDHVLGWIKQHLKQFEGNKRVIHAISNGAHKCTA